MTLVVDASVALKWVLAEAGADRAEALVGSEPLVAPDFLLLECANVLSTLVRRSALDPGQAAAGLQALRDSPLRLVPSAPHVPDAHALSVRLNHSAYDCLYLAVALAERAVVVTADERFVRVAEAQGDHLGVVRRL